MSLTLSIAFVTLILGYLLGHSTSDRFHRQKQLREQHNQRRFDEILTTIEDELINYTLNNSKVQSFYNANFTIFESDYRKNFTVCLETTQESLGYVSVDNFIRIFFKEEHDIFLTCARNMINFLGSY